MADGVVQLAPDGTGKKVDTAEVSRADGTIVERQRVQLSGAGLKTLVEPINTDPVIDDGNYDPAYPARQTLPAMPVVLTSAQIDALLGEQKTTNELLFEIHQLLTQFLMR